MLQGNALRHQMVLPQQTAIYDYWRSRCKNGAFPSRFDIEPEHITTHLPTVSLLEVVPGALEKMPLKKMSRKPSMSKPSMTSPRYRYRLAGTGFWSLYEEEIQGRYVDELPIGDRREYWHRILGNIVTKRRPMAGVTRPGTPVGSHLAQFWIRMPLSTDGENIDLILGYDHLVKLSSVAGSTEEAAKIYA